MYNHRLYYILGARTVSRHTVVPGLQLISRRIHHEVPELSTEWTEPAHLPVDPVETLGALDSILGNELAVLLRKVLYDRGRFKQRNWLAIRSILVHTCGNLRVGVYCHEPLGELLSFADVDHCVKYFVFSSKDEDGIWKSCQIL